MTPESPLSLSKVANVGRVTIKYGIIFLVVMIVGRVLLGSLISFWIATHPPLPPPPTVGFGKLPELVFPVKNIDQKPKSYQIETADGRFPRFGDRAKVFLIPRQSSSLLADERVKEMAVSLGYGFEPTPMSESRYRWTKSSPMRSALEIDLLNNTFTIDTEYLSRPELLRKRIQIEEDGASDFVKSVIATAVRTLPSDIATSSARVGYSKSSGGELLPAVSYSDADFLTVDIFRQPIDNFYKVIGPDGKSGVAHAVIAGSFSGLSNVMSLRYLHRPVEYSQFHTYPLITPALAWQIMQSGEGYVADKGSFDTAVVRDVSLGYYDDFNDQLYLQPIYIFEGDGGFVGYVPALDATWFQKL